MNDCEPCPECRLIHADCTSVLQDIGPVDHVITDPPYGGRTHAKQKWDSGETCAARNAALEYDHLDPDQAIALGVTFKRLASKWVLVMTSHDLFPSWEEGLGAYTFAPLPIVMKGMNIRLAGDGPSNWTVWMAASRRTGYKDGTKPGAYWVAPESGPDRAAAPVRGAKPLALMEQIITDWTKPGDLVLDPFLGTGTTGVACVKLGRRFIGIEQDRKAFDYSRERIARVTAQRTLFDPEPVQYDPFRT